MKFLLNNDMCIFLYKLNSTWFVATYLNKEGTGIFPRTHRSLLDTVIRTLRFPVTYKETKDDEN